MDTLELRCGGTQVHIDRFGAMFTAEFPVNGFHGRCVSERLTG